MKKIHNLILLDESGSMDSIRTSALSAMNETIQTIKMMQKEKNEYEHSVSFVTFNGNGSEGVKFVRLNVPAEAVKEMTLEDYIPGGCTPLYDAIGLSLNTLEKLVTEEDVVLVSIITDGMENSSHQYSGMQIKTLIDKQKEKGWTFTYMGANQDSKSVAGNIGIVNTLDFEASDAGVVEMNTKYKRSYEAWCINDDLMLASDCFFEDKDV